MSNNQTLQNLIDIHGFFKVMQAVDMKPASLARYTSNASRQIASDVLELAVYRLNDDQFTTPEIIPADIRKTRTVDLVEKHGVEFLSIITGISEDTLTQYTRPGCKHALNETSLGIIKYRLADEVK